MGVDTQALTMQMNPCYGLINNRTMQECLYRSAVIFGRFLQNRISNLHSQQIPLSREGANIVIEKLRRIQPRSKIKKLEKIRDQIPWELVEGSGFSVVPHSGTLVFIKNEGYPSGVKPPRLIAFPQEGEKLIMSMAFYHIMYPLFSSGYCTKEIPEHERPRRIEERLGELPINYCTDYTSWECVPNKMIMQLGEHLVEKMLVDPAYYFIFDFIERGGTLSSKSGVKIRTSAVQYSGRYTTSLSNTIRNKLMMDAVSMYLGISYRGVFEGDDGLTSWPENMSVPQLQDALGRLGVVAEVKQVEARGSAGYCSTYWNEKYELIYDPIKVVATFPFSTSQLSSSPKNAKPLIAAKAMSLAYRAPGCPIAWAIARRYIQPEGIMETRNEYERRWFSRFSERRNRYKASKHQRNAQSSMKVIFKRWDLIRPPTPEQRRFFMEIFNIEPADQRLAEKHILEDDGFTITLVSLLEGAQVATGNNIQELLNIYNYMRYAHAGVRIL